MNIKEYYHNLEPKKKVDFFRNVYDVVFADDTIRCDDEALLDFTEMIIDIQDAIIVSNTLKEKLFLKEKELTEIKTKLKYLEDFKTKSDTKIEEIKVTYEQRLEELRKAHEEELSKFISERLEKKSEELFGEDDLPLDIVNFVKLQIENIRELLTFEKKSVTEIKKSYDLLCESSNDPMMKEFSKLIVNVIDEKNIFQKSKFKEIEFGIMKRIDEALR